MGKILESLGAIDGYDIISIGKSRAKRDSLFEEIEKKDKKIKEEVRKIVNNSNGMVFAITKNSKIKGIYLFKANEKDKKELNHFKTVYVDEVKEETREKYDKFLIEAAKELVSYQEYKKVTFGDNQIEMDPQKSSVELFLTSFSGFILGAMTGWMLFHSMLWVFAYGLLFAIIFSSVDVVVTNVKGKKKKK